MQYNRKRDLGKCGIYLIRNKINNKIYIGKAKCIDRRIKQHITLLNRKSKDENPHLINAWHKYGKDAFEYIVLEYLDFNEEQIKERECFWITHLNALDPKVGYNLRLDSSTGMITSEETKLKLRESRNKRSIKFPELNKKVGEITREFWKNNPEAREQMSKNVKLAKQKKYRYLQYDKEMNLIQIWDTVEEILKVNPNYKWQNIYAASNGNKPTMYGYIWRKELKI